MVSCLAAEIYQAVPDPEGGSVLATWSKSKFRTNDQRHSKTCQQSVWHAACLCRNFLVWIVRGCGYPKRVQCAADQLALQATAWWLAPPASLEVSGFWCVLVWISASSRTIWGHPSWGWSDSYLTKAMTACWKFQMWYAWQFQTHVQSFNHDMCRDIWVSYKRVPFVPAVDFPASHSESIQQEV